MSRLQRLGHRALLVIFTFLWAVWVEGSLSPVAFHERKAIAVASLAAYGLLSLLWLRHNESRHVIWHHLLVVLGLVLAALGTQPAAVLAGGALTLLGVGWSGSHGDLRSRLGCALSGLALLHAARELPPVRNLFEAVAGAISGVLTGLVEETLDLGPTVLGLDMLVIAIALVLATFASVRWKLAGIGVSFVACVLIAVRWVLETQSKRPFTMEGFEEGPIWFSGAGLLFGVSAAAVGVVAMFGEPATRGASSPGRRGVIIGLVALALGLSVSVDLAKEAGSLKALVVASHSTSRFERPTDLGVGYQEGDGGGLYVDLLKAAGHEVDLKPLPATNEELHQFDVVLFMFPEAPSEEDAPRLEKFAAQGGGILFVHDHTPPDYRLDPINALLKRFDLTYRFDSAFLHAMPLKHCERATNSPSSRARRRSAEDNYGVGAGLDMGWTGECLIDARYAVSDRGHLSTPSLVGNRHYEHGDRLGDVPVVATGTLGSGRLVVCGDATSFQNSSLPMSWPLVRQLTELAAVGRISLPAVMRGAVALVLLLLVLFRARWVPSLGWAGVAMGVTLGSLGLGEGEPPLPSPERVAMVDVSAPTKSISLDRSAETSIKGFANVLYRGGLSPVVVRSSEAGLVPPPAMLALIAPGKLGSDRKEAVMDYVRGGGHLWLACGFEEAQPSHSLLEAFGVAVLPIPLGSTRHFRAEVLREMDHANTLVHFEEAWALDISKRPDAQVLLTHHDHPFAVRVAVGEGTVTIFADSYFFCDRNVASQKQGFKANQQLLVQLIKEQS